VLQRQRFKQYCSKAVGTIDCGGLCHYIIHRNFLPSGDCAPIQVHVHQIKAAFGKGIHTDESGVMNKRLSKMKNISPASVSRASKTKRWEQGTSW
jgi:hypothetical protein